jgi:signal transduction histidine kinase
MKPLYYLMFLVLISSPYATKANGVDSLLQTIQTEKKDTNTVNTLIKITNILRSNYPDSAYIYAKKALSLSEKLGFSKGENAAIYQLAVIEYFKGNYEKALEYIEMSKVILSRNKSLQKELAASLNVEGSIYKNMGDYVKAIEVYNQSLKIAENQNDYHTWVLVSNNKANIYRREGKHDKAIKIYEKALNLCKIHNLEADRTLVLGNIGLVYKEQKNYEIALKYYKEVLAIHRKNNNKRNAATILNNIGNLYGEQKKYSQALKAQQEALDIREEIGDLPGEASSLINIADIYLNAFRDYDKALNYAQRGLGINRKTNSNTDIANALIVIANIYKEQKNYNKAIDNAKQGLSFLDNIDALSLKKEACRILSESYELTGNYKDAVICFRQYQEIKDTIFSQRNRDAINNLNRRYNTEQHELELASQQALLDKEKTKRSLYLGIILFLVALGGLSFYTIQQKQSANQKLKQLNEEAKAHNDELLMAQNRLKLANQDLNSFTSMASHDLKEPLRMMSSFSQLLKRRNKNLNESSQEYIDYIIDAAQRMSRMLDDMLNYSTNRIYIENMEYLNTNEVLATVQKNLQLRIEENNAIVRIVNDLPQIKGQKSLIEQIFQNLIANGIKFQRLNVRPEITITAESTGKENIFKITDNGIGIASENQAKVFQLFQRFNEQYEGSGIGLTTCKKIMELHNGTIDLESEIGQGTTFILKFPK